jgi:hypothetical protein
LIVITGGRSGTTLLAALYRELGFDPGGTWHEESRSGYEDEAVTSLNRAVLDALMAGPPDEPPRSPSFLRKSARAALPISVRVPVSKALGLYRPEEASDPTDFLPGMIRGRPGRIQWNRMNDVVGRFGQPIREVAAATPVAKDPTFGWTLGVWVLAGAPIDHVVVCVRALEAMERSRARMVGAQEGSIQALKERGIDRLGTCIQAIYEHDLEHSIIRFPHFVKDPDGLYGALRFPTPVTRQRFRIAFDAIVRPELIHDWS